MFFKRLISQEVIRPLRKFNMIVGTLESALGLQLVEEMTGSKQEIHDGFSDLQFIHFF